MGQHDPGGEVLLKSKRFTIKRKQIAGNDGKEHAHDFIVHPGAAVILPIMNDGRLLLLRNQRYAVGEKLLELPAGTLDDGEAPRDCAMRELEEETGWKAAKMEPLVKFFASPGILTEMMHVFVASDLSRGQEHLDPTERLEVAPLTLEEALAAARDGRIHDAKTLIGLLYYNTFRRSAEKT